MDRVILLLDMNSYFASVEQVTNPSLRGKPVIVCGEGRTVVTTASYEARKFGVKTGMSLYEARRCCPQVINVRGNMDKYVDTSLRIHKILLEFTGQVEPFSIDECFMDITSLCKNPPQSGTPLYGHPSGGAYYAPPYPFDKGGRKGGFIGAVSVALEIKQRIKEELGLLCSIGIGPNKVVAKIASKLQKPDGLVEIKKEEVPEWFAHFPIEELQGVGVGKKTSQKLISIGIGTAKQLGDASEDLLVHHFGVMGYYLKSIGNGEDSAPVKDYDYYEQIKSVGHSYTLPRDTRDTAVLRSYLLMLSEKVGVRLRRAGMMGRTVSLTVRHNDFNTFSRQSSLPRSITTGGEIYSSALKIFSKLLPLAQPVRLLGVSISNLSPEDKQQFLFDDIAKQQKLAALVDDINEKFGAFTVKPSSLLIAEKFGVYKPCGMAPKARQGK